jgi:hypothetical protein
MGASGTTDGDSARFVCARGVVVGPAVLTGGTTPVVSIERVVGDPAGDLTVACGGGSGVTPPAVGARGAACGAGATVGAREFALAAVERREQQTNKTTNAASPPRASELAAQESARNCPRSRCV